MAPEFPKKLRSIQNLQDIFTQRYFPGGDAFNEQIIKLHDAAHQWSNINPTARGELQQQIVDATGAQLLGETLGAQGFVNALPAGSPRFTPEVLQNQIEGLKELSQMISEGSLFGESALMGAPGQEINSPSRFIFPALTNKEITELQKRGREFYGQVGQNYLQQVNAGRIPKATGAKLTEMKFSPQAGVTLDFPVNPQALAIHENPNRIKVKGGYDIPGTMSFGPMMQRMNTPMEIMVDQPDWAYAGKEYLTKDAFPAIQMGHPGETLEDIKARINARAKFRNSYGGFPIQDMGLLEYGDAPKPGESNASFYKRLEQDQLADFQVKANEYPYRPTTDIEFTQSAALVDPSLQRAYNKLFAIAKNRGNLRNIIKGATTSAADIAGSVPLFDPAFRQAVEQGDTGKVVRQLGTEYLAGTVAAPVIGMGVGALSQVAPQAARAVAGGLNAARAANPIAVVSQLGGSSKINKQADTQAAKAQLARAEAARRRGGKWKFPTPFGTLTIPEFGISEAGGLLLR